MYLLNAGVQLVDHIHVLYCWGHFVFLLVVHLTDNVPQVFSRTRLGKTGNDMANLETSNRTNVLSHEFYALLGYALGTVGLKVFCLDCYKGNWYFSLDLISDSNNYSLGNHIMLHQYFFHLSSRKTMPSSIDNIILPRHHMEVPLLIEIPRISRVVVTR